MTQPRASWSALGNRRTAYALAICAIIGAPSDGQGQAGDDGAAIRQARSEQNRAIAARDLNRVASFWIHDVQLTAGLGFTLAGRELYRGAFALDSILLYERLTDTVVVSQDWPLAWEEGTWTGRRPGHLGPPLISGRYTAMWVKLGGRWLIRSEQFVALHCSDEACRWPLSLNH